jgi:two-component system nitrogen regulation response regulator NtrX
MPDRLHLLVVDDDNDFSNDFAVLSRDLFHLTIASTGEEGLEAMDEAVPDAVILDLRLGAGIDGMETLKQIRTQYADLPVIMVTEHASIETAVEAMKQGAFHYMSKHPNMKELHAIIQRELGSAKWKRLFLEEVRRNYGEMIGDSPVMKTMYQVISRAAPTSLNVLIEGENGSGKELVAREIHARSGRAHYPFVPVNCAAIPPSLFESELFGHEKGAFTGATERKIGKFELAHRGTLFLDEISCLHIEFQPKFLRILDDQSFTRVGGNETIQVDTRIISASNTILKDEVQYGRFREDLYHRIDGLSILVPPLRDREEDIPKLALYFAKRMMLRAGGKGREFTPEAMDALKKYKWPGNVRELRNVVERTLVLADDRPVTAQDLNLVSSGSRTDSFFDDVLNLHYDEARQKILSKFKSVYLSAVLKRNHGNLTQAAKEA